MKKLNTLQRTLLKELIRSGSKLDIYTLFRRSKVGYSVYYKSIQDLIGQEYVVKEENIIYLTKDAKEKVMVLGFSSCSEKRVWREVPDKMKCENISSNEFYIPSRKLFA